MTDDFDRVPPHDVEAEQSVLGSMLLSRNAISEVLEILQPGDFYRPQHETVFRTIAGMYAGGEPVDPITVADALTKSGELGKVGGSTYVHHLVNTVPTAANGEYYAEIVHARAVLRRLVEAGTRMVQMGYAAEGDVAEILDAAGAEFNAVARDRQDDEGALIGDDYAEMVDELEALQRDGHATGVLTGFTDLDGLTHGLHPGQMLIVAGRPGLGKSTLGVDFVRACAIKQQRPAVFFSLEMSRREVQHRIYSAEARIALHHIRGGSMNGSDWDRFAAVRERVAGAPLTIDATPGRTLMQIKAKCRRIQQRSGLDLVVIDYLQLMQSGVRRPENRQVEVSEMSRNIKLLAKELNVPVVVLAQLNRGPEQRQDKKPMLSDLRESGSLEQDADVVILVHREDAYDRESPRAGEADLMVVKHRNGPPSTITVASQLHYSRFVDMAQT